MKTPNRAIVFILLILLIAPAFVYALSFRDVWSSIVNFFAGIFGAGKPGDCTAAGGICQPNRGACDSYCQSQGGTMLACDIGLTVVAALVNSPLQQR